MKRIFTLTALVLFSVAFGFGQTGIYGGGFEHWKQVPTYNYYEPDSSIFSTLNKLDTVAAMRPMVTVYPCDTAHSGNYSARLVTCYFNLLNIIIPGVIGTIKLDWVYQRAILGMPYPYGDSLPHRFSGYYQSYPTGADSSAVVFLLSRWNPTLHERDTLAYNYQAFTGTVNTWTPFSIPISYWNSTRQPDSLTILLLSCGGFNARNMFGSKGQVGSTALFDDVSLTEFLGLGVPALSQSSTTVRLSPNPATDILKIEIGNAVKDGYFEIYNAQEKLMNRFQVNGKTSQISVSDLPAGMYYYKLTESNSLLNTGKFIVIK